ncbi:MAG: hypothetical protein F9K29_07460 [Hyphomicrobiaceae bacterium]|nr:MAG: hypothetical protein F9K29_07460 [Hyphomicrobiaceae bacterium]
MSALLHKISYGLRSQGLNYLVTAPVNELANPRLPITRYVRSAIISIRDRFGAAKADNEAWSDDALQFFYDLAASPVTFDFASYLAAAEMERRLRKLREINVIFVLGPKAGVRKELPDYEAAIDVPTRLARLRNILIPMLAFLPSVKSYAVCGSREQAEAIIAADRNRIHPSDYRVYLPRQPAKKDIFEHARAGLSIWPMLRATDAGKRFVADFLAREAKGRKAVVITLRNYGYSPERNSRNADWIAFANSLDPAVFVPIFVHDTETSMREPPADFGQHVVCHAASWSLEIRMALYEAAWLNMALMHGPMELCWYNEKARYVLFMTVGTAAINTEASLISNGHRLGVDLEFAKPYQRIVWKRDDLPALLDAFALMEKALSSQSALCGMSPASST